MSLTTSISNSPRKKPGKILLYFLGGLLALLLVLFVYVMLVSKVDPPKPPDISAMQWHRAEPSRGFYTIGNNWFRKSNSGLYELYIEGAPFERGAVNGKLTKELLVKQEDYFNEQINRMVPSRFYLHFLKYFVGWFNRDLDKHVTEEYKEEIYGISGSASDEYQYIGSNYQRILNYHAAHDIGHALQNLALVGCTSFGTWDERSADSSMIIGRNFDFYVGDKFAENKIVAFESPSQGHKFMFVTWGGFIGVVSGMNDKGLTVTINAAKSKIPSGSATPVSMVAREILQYAENIDQALAIAKKRKMFVSESFLLGSAEDHKAVIMEKTPDSIGVYDPGKDFIVCSNHFQSDGLAHSNSNIEQMERSSSVYRYKRVRELLDSNGKNTVEKTVAILRDHKGLQNDEIGLGNEKAINQLIAHHSIVFEPEKLLVWVSTSPWQLGKFMCYDLKKVFRLRGMKTDHEICDTSLTIAADPFLLTRQFQNFEKYRTYKSQLQNDLPVNMDSFIQTNPEFYHTYVLAGDYSYKHHNYPAALHYYQQALTKVIATRNEEDYIHEQIRNCLKKTQTAAW
ncbi:MAG: peptidase C45 [Bacteroidetes bacterium]|nr:MAG: peptidase C45 [Bacteroidota bacterium]